MSSFLKLDIPPNWAIKKLKEVCRINPDSLDIT